MKYRHLILLFAATFQMVACGKNNPEPGGGGSDSPRNTPAIILQQDFTKGLGAFTVQDKDKGGFSGKSGSSRAGPTPSTGPRQPPHREVAEPIMPQRAGWFRRR